MLLQFIHRARGCTVLAADLIGAGAHVEGATQASPNKPQFTLTEALSRAEMRYPLCAAWRAHRGGSGAWRASPSGTRTGHPARARQPRYRSALTNPALIQGPG